MAATLISGPHAHRPRTATHAACGSAFSYEWGDVRGGWQDDGTAFGFHALYVTCPGCGKSAVVERETSAAAEAEQADRWELDRRY